MVAERKRQGRTRTATDASGIRAAPAWGGLWLVALSALTVNACTGAVDEAQDPPHVAPAPQFLDAPLDSVFDLVDQIRLAESDSALITGIQVIAVARDGRIAIPDRIESQVRVYASDGGLLANLGGFGEGPGEFQRPWTLAFGGDGTLFVSDAAVPRITRYSRAITFDTVFAVTDAFMVAAMAPAARGIVVGHLRDPLNYDVDFLATYSAGGAKSPSFHRVDRRILDVPYWWSVLGQLDTGGYLLATAPDRVYAGNALTYPIHEYTLGGAPLGTVGAPPPSWQQAQPLEQGALSGPDLPRLIETYLRSMTTIDRIGVLEDSLLVVSHRQLDAGDLKYRDGTYRVDVYDSGGAKQAEDLHAPGRFLFASRYAYFLISSAPDPWVIGRYEIRRRR